jgi:RNA polymerase sigma-70 factor (ECF subfamily)
VRSGDPEAFGVLVERYEKRVFGLALMVVRDRAGAEEVTQDAFLRAFRRLDLYDLSRPFYPWLATIAVRLAQTWRQRRARTDEREGAELAPAREPRATSDPLAELLRDETSRRLWRRVVSLPPGERTSVFLFYRQELKVNEIASALGVSAGTVKTWLFRARGKLRALHDQPASCVAEEGEARTNAEEPR